MTTLAGNLCTRFCSPQKSLERAVARSNGARMPKLIEAHAINADDKRIAALRMAKLFVGQSVY